MEPLTSRYPMNNRSLGHVFANVFADPMFKVEGMLVWMYHRCEGRVRRGNKRVLNGFRMQTLQQMIKVCYDFAGMTASESQNMMDNVVAMTDLSDDEYTLRELICRWMRNRSRSSRLTKHFKLDWTWCDR